MASGPPHDGLLLAVPHLALLELLALSEVCVSLRDAVMGDVLPWMNIMVHRPLNRRLSDQILLKLSSRANGRLRSLVLIDCVHITDYGLLRVLQNNPLINQLYIPACTSLTPEGIIRAVSINKNSCLQRLRIHGIPNITKDHLITLNSLLQMKKQQQGVVLDPNYEVGRIDQDRAIDVETCPKCNEVRLVLRCTRSECDNCKGCEYCVPRCVECGGCVKSEDLEEAVSACAHDLCFNCWFKLPKCSFCNKPYCSVDAHQWCHGHICYDCHEKAVYRP